ncbi:MAG: hypothetical protein WAT39_05645 [Planctomycetota bacterium]
MNGRELTILCGVLACLFSVVSLVAAFLRAARKNRQPRQDALLAALNDPGLDATTRAELLRALAREHRTLGSSIANGLRNPTTWRVLWFGAGWLLTLLAGMAVAMHALDIARLGSEELPVAMILATAGFGMLSLPLAWRELTRRERVADPR